MRYLLAILLSGAAFAQTKAPAPVLGMNNFIHATDDLDKTVAFYTDVFGLAKPAPPRPPNPAVPALINAPGAQLRVAVLRIPGSPFSFELTYFGAIERKGARPQPTDPGAAFLVLKVRELGPITAALQRAQAPVVSRSSAGTIMVRDPDGYLVQVQETPAAAGAPASGNILGAEMGMVVSDMDATAKFYRQMLGFELSGDPKFSGTKATLDLFGAAEKAQFRRMSGTVPGTQSRMEFTEFKGVARTPFHLRVADPGCPAIAFRVDDLDALLKRAKAAGITVVSAGGVPAQFSATIRNIFIEDPSGFKIELYQTAQ
jgi:catechol 2,3-dioxygenase-like lactoylglutathione lyase family enzyme